MHLGLRVLLKKSFLILTLVGAASQAQAGSAVLSSRDVGAPAVDLLYQGEVLDRDAAVDLHNKGVDLSTLDPQPNDVWKPQPQPAVDDLDKTFPADGVPVSFDSFLPATNSLFRARVASVGPDGQKKHYQLMASLEGHAVLARSAMLRRLGFAVSTPRYYRALTVHFESVDQRRQFLDSLSDATLLNRMRWIEAMPPDFAEVTLHDVVLEPAQITSSTRMYHWGVLDAADIKGRRALRSLILPLVLLDIPESANLYSYELGKTINNSAILTHPYAEAFGESTFEDAKWIARKIALLSVKDLQEIVDAAKLPSDVAALVLQKLTSRRNHMVEIFLLRDELLLPWKKYAFDPKITVGAVLKGKLTQTEYPGYALRFTHGDPEAPLRAPELGRFLGLNLIQAGISAAMGQVTKLFTVQNASDLQLKHQSDIQRQVQEHFQNNPGKPFTLPVQAWGGPVGGFSVSASRNVVTGTYYGSDATVQMVDNISLGVNVGFFMGVDGLPYVSPSLGGNVALQRNFLHVRPLAEMKDALKLKSWPSLWLPAFMPGLADGMYKDMDPNDDTKVDAALKKFMDSLKEGEMFIITDTLSPGVKGQINVSIPVLMNPALIYFNPSIGLAGSAMGAVYRRTTLVKTADGFQVYLQRAQTLALDAEFNFNWLVNIFRLGHTYKLGHAITRTYQLENPLDNAEERRKVLLSLRMLLRSNTSAALEDHYQPYELHHDLEAKINRAKALWLEYYGIEEEHRVRVSPPGHPEMVRTLYSHKRTNTRGQDVAGFIMDAVKAVVPAAGISIGSPSGYNPANAFLGHSTWTSIGTEAELTPGGMGLSSTQIEQHWGGWVLPKSKLMKILDIIEAKIRPLNLDRPLIRREEFATTTKLQMYEISSNLMIYEEGLKNIGAMLFHPQGARGAVNQMVAIEGVESVNKFCKDPMHKLIGAFGKYKYTFEENGKKLTYKCLMPWMLKILSAREELIKKPLPRTGEDQIKWTNKLVNTVHKEMELPTFLKWIGNKNYFFQIRVTGFRVNDENGDMEYLSDSVGTFNADQGGGVFKDFSAKYRILSNELYARYLSGGY